MVSISSTANVRHSNWVIHWSTTKSCHAIGPSNPSTDFFLIRGVQGNKERVVDEKLRDQRLHAEFVRWLWFPRLFWRWHVFMVFALYSLAGWGGCSVCSGWWLSNFSPRLHQAPSSWVTTVGQGEKALMWKQPLLYLISPLNHIKEMWRRGSKPLHLHEDE